MRFIALYIFLIASLRICSPEPEAQMSQYIADYATLSSEFSSAKEGDTIRLGAVNVNGKPPLILSASGVTVLGGNIRSTLCFEDQVSAAIINKGTGNKFIGITFQGPSDNQYDEMYSLRFSWCAIKNEGDSTLIDKCKFTNCQKWAVWMARCGNSVIKRSTFMGTVGQGYGYGIWCGSIETRQQVKIEGCTFNRNRVHIDGSGHLNDIIIDSCTFGKQTTFVPVQRHDRSTSRTFGGRNMYITRCIFMDSIEPVRPCIPADSGGLVLISGNSWRWTNCRDVVNAGSYFCSKPDSKVRFENNLMFGLPTDHVNEPEVGTFIMNIKSSYWKGLSPYSIIVNVNDSIVYRSNVSGKLSWKKLSLKIPNIKTFSITIQCDSNITDTTRSEIQVWLDDIGTQGLFSSFESTRLPVKWKQSVFGTWSTGVRSSESVSGSRCFMIRQPFRARPEKGWYVKITATR